MIQIAILIVSVSALVGVFLLFKRSSGSGSSEAELKVLSAGIEKLENRVREEISRNREELARTLKDASDTSSKQLIGLTGLNEEKLNSMRKTIEERLKALQDDNSQKLERMRQTVDEKLHETLEKRLGDSFKIVSERLEQVHKGLGEMQTLAAGVGDLKKVLSNVKTKGVMGEIQLEGILEQMLTPEQFTRNYCAKKGSRESVEFAIKLPGKGEDPVWLPIDSKFPTEDYQRLLDAEERADKDTIQEVGKALEDKIRSMAADIRDKYVDPPATTDFGILFLPFEGLYAEVLRRPGLFELLQRQYRVTVTGPTTLSAFLSSLQMGFRTLTIEKRSSEVWALLETVKKEFGNFGGLLDKANEQLQTVSRTMEKVGSKSRTIERKLKNVQGLPGSALEELQAPSEDAPAADKED